MAEWEDQYKRMGRWLDRTKEQTEMGKGEINPVQLKDTFISYFQNCYHLQDYLVNDSSTTVTESDVDSFIDTTDCMTLCADICNATKHLQLNGSGRSGEEPEMSDGAHVTSNVSEMESSATYMVETNSGEKDAAQLAEECKSAWDTFLQSQGLSI